LNDKVTETDNLLGYRVVSVNTAACVDAVLDTLRNGNAQQSPCRVLACINPHSYVISRADPLFAEALAAADWLVPDGAGIILASRMLKGRIRARITGSDIFHGVNAALNRLGGGRVFFLGATEEVLTAIKIRMASDYPNVEVSGVYSPPFKDVFSDSDTRRMLTAVNTAQADVLWLGMTAPKQEKWLYSNAGRLNVKFAAAVGAVFDFYTGRVQRPSATWQALGLEWLPRFLKEPRRLWRRNFVSAPKFLLLLLTEMIRGRNRSKNIFR
jgi:N-acetylglucosaminyldiphosphoundecaprenol N-acetyl-beta-D-mannosaminyltransferase